MGFPLRTPPVSPSSLACHSPRFIRAPGWRGQGQLCRPSPQPPDWLPAQASGCPGLRRVSGALPAPLLLPRWQPVCVGEAGLPLPLPDICRLPRREAHPGEGAWQEGISEVLTSQTHSCFGATSCVRPGSGPHRGYSHREAGAVTCSVTGPRKGLRSGEGPRTLTPLWGSQESWHTLVPLPSQSLHLRSPHPSVTIPLCELGRGLAPRGLSCQVCPSRTRGPLCGDPRMLTTSAR